MSTSALVLTLFIAWALFLLVLMEIIRSYLVVSGQARSNEFTPDNAEIRGQSAFLLDSFCLVNQECALPLFLLPGNGQQDWQRCQVRPASRNALN